MNNQEKFKELLKSYAPVIDLDMFVSGDKKAGVKEKFGQYELKDMSNEYDF